MIRFAMKRTYQAPWDRTLMMLSIGVTVLCLIVAIVRPFLLDGKLTWHATWPLLILVSAAPFAILGYTVDDEEIGIRRLFWTTKIKRDGLQSAEMIPKAMSGSLRTCGNGGLFSFTGWYWSKKLRSYRAYVTHREKTVVLRFAKRTLVVSPDDPQRFADDLNGKVGDV
jgi:hypothetical protein